MKRPRAWSPGEGHRFLPGASVCVYCGMSQESVRVQRLCRTGVLYDFSEKQGKIRYDYARTLAVLE